MCALDSRHASSILLHGACYSCSNGGVFKCDQGQDGGSRWLSKCSWATFYFGFRMHKDRTFKQHSRYSCTSFHPHPLTVVKSRKSRMKLISQRQTRVRPSELQRVFEYTFRLSGCYSYSSRRVCGA